MAELALIALVLPGLIFLFTVVSTLLVHHREALWEHRDGICDRCGYNLTGNSSGVCPECGLRTE